jgi:acylphosphatase
MKTVRLLIRGRVQGVGFRYFVRREATRLGLNGWVRNLANGNVEAVISGDSGAIAEMTRLTEKGPPGAEVSEVTATPAEAPPQPGFAIVG